MKIKKETTYIYGLADPRDGSIRYVGKSDNPESRYYQHLVDRTTNRYKSEWIQDLSQWQLKPDLIIFEQVDADQWTQAERHYMDLGQRRGWPLTNIVNYSGNGYDPIGDDEGINEVMYPFLPVDLWNVFCGLPMADRQQIARMVAMQMMDLSGLAIRARGGEVKRDYNQAYQYLMGSETAVALVRTYGTSRYDQLMTRLETATRHLTGVIDGYMATIV